MLKIAEGRIIIYRLYDVAHEIDLDAIEERLKKVARRLRLSRLPYTKALEFKNPPLSVKLESIEKVIEGDKFGVNVIGKVYDFGVISIAYEIDLKKGLSTEDLERLAIILDKDPSFDESAVRYVERFIQNFSQAFVEPEIKKDFLKDYTIFFIKRFDRPLTAREILAEYNPARLLLYEEREISPETREETIKTRFSYYPDDLVILHLDNAFIVEPSGSMDIPDLLEFANAQLLELYYYDTLLDTELDRIYTEMAKRKVSIFGLREYERLARKTTETFTELTEVTEKINNALKVTEDVYYARVYHSIMRLLRSQEWENSIKEKLQILTDSYKIIYEEISTKRGQLIELGIFLLIVLEIFLAFALK